MTTMGFGGQWNSNHVPFANIAQGWNRWGLLKQTKERHASPNILKNRIIFVVGSLLIEFICRECLIIYEYDNRENILHL